MKGCSRALRALFGSCTHAAHLTVAAHGPGLFEGSRDRLPKLALKKLYESRRNHDLGAPLLAALLPHCWPVKGCSRALRALFGSCTDASHLTVAAHGSSLIPGQAVEPTPLTSQWPPTDRGCSRAPGTGSPSLL